MVYMNIRKADIDEYARRNMAILNRIKSAKAHGKQKKIKKKRDMALFELDHMYQTLINTQISRIKIQYERIRSIRKQSNNKLVLKRNNS